MRPAEEVAEAITSQLFRNEYSGAAYALVKIANNGRRTLVRLRVERHLTQQQITLWGLCIFKLLADCDVPQEPPL